MGLAELFWGAVPTVIPSRDMTSLRELELRRQPLRWLRRELESLGERAGLGLLAIASHDTERYLPTRSTDYLVRIGEIVTEAVSARLA